MKQLNLLLGLVSCLALCLALSGRGDDDGSGEGDGMRAALGRRAGRMLNVGFYVDFVPLSYSRDNQAPTHSEAYNTLITYGVTP